MIQNQNVATRFLNHSARLIRGVQANKDQMVKINLTRCDYEDFNFEKLRNQHLEADAADNLYLGLLKKKNPDVIHFTNKLGSTFKIVEKHLDLLNLVLKDDPELGSIIALKKPLFFYDTDEALALAKTQYENILKSGKAQLALKQYGVGIDEIRETASNVLGTLKEREIYIYRQPEAVRIEKERHVLFVKLAESLAEIETVAFITLRGQFYKDGKNILMDLGIPFLATILDNHYIPPDDKMVKDSSIT